MISGNRASSFLVGCALLGSLTAPLSAQRKGGPLILEIPASAAALSLGTAFPLSRRSSDVLFYNPSLLLRASGFALGGERFDGRNTHAHFSGATPWRGGSIGIGLQTLSYDTDAALPSEVPEGPADLLAAGSRAVSELVVTAGFARQLAGIRWGLAAKAIEQRLGPAHESTVALDLGASVTLSDVTVGLAAQNLGPAMGDDEAELDLARRFTLGAAFHGLEAGPLDLGATSAVSRESDGTILPAAGFEVAWWPVVGRTFIGRLGIRRVKDSDADPFTFGGAFIGDDITLEYAFQGYDGAGASHRIGMSWR